MYPGEGDECYPEKPLLKFANSIRYNDGSALNTTYERVFGDHALQTDFEAQDSPTIVNDWVENLADGVIDSIVPVGEPFYPPNILIAINSIYLKASWTVAFDESKTNLDVWYLPDLTDSLKAPTIDSVEAHFMNIVDNFDYSSNALPGLEVIKLPFKNSFTSMIFVVPIIQGAPFPFLDTASVIASLDLLESTIMALSLPKFKFESTYGNLQIQLKSLGITNLFTPGKGALCGVFDSLADCENIYISQVIQKTSIDVNEKGIMAAAVTANMLAGSSGEIPPNPTLLILDL